MSCKIQCKKFRHKPKSYKFKVKFKVPKNPDRPTLFGPEQLARFLESLQILYNHACEKFDVMPHQLRIEAIGFPKHTLKFRGLKDPARAVANALEAAPDVIAAVATDEFNSKDAGSTHATHSDHQHLDALKKIITDLEKIKRSNWKTYIQYALGSELGAHVSLKKHIRVTRQ